jgi:hypothetical protein
MKRFLTSPDNASSSKSAKTESDFLSEITNNRHKVASDVTAFKFNKKRVKMLNKYEEVAEGKR